MKFFSLLLLASSVLAFHTMAQTGTATLSAADKINQVYLDAATSMNSEQLAWQHNILSRCEVVDIPFGASTPPNIQALAQVPLLTKYGAVLSHDSTYDAATFNPLKYSIDFFEDKVQYFRIGSTNKVLKVGAKL